VAARVDDKPFVRRSEVDLSLPRAIDHVVIAAHDLDAQAALFRRLGFQVGPRNRHPWGTENHIVQFEGSFLELVGLGKGFVAPSPAPGVYSFAGFLAAFLQRREGAAMLVMHSTDAEADRAEFARAGIGDFARFDFARKGRSLDGAEVDVAFSLAYAQAHGLPDAGFFVCQQHFPENFWNARLQVHRNGVGRIAGLVLAQARPQERVDFMRSFVGASKARAIEGGFAIETNGAEIEVLTWPAIGERYGAAVVASDGPPLAVLRLGVEDIAVTGAILAQGGTPFTPRGESLVVAAADALGVAIVFE
jgi:Glyoxalase-like domain